MTSYSMIKALLYLHGILFVNISIVNRTFKCSCTYITGLLKVYIVQHTIKAWMTLAHPADMPSFSEMLAPFHMSSQTQNVFKYV